MGSVDIREKCRINTNLEADKFVGIKCEAGDFSVHFPLGYRLSEADEELRKDIFSLISVIGNFTDHRDSEIVGEARNSEIVDIPIQSYIYVIKDFISRGYYREKEVVYTQGKKGKINWNRTIKNQKPYVQDQNVFYLDFIIKKNTIQENEIITLIHEFCVYESYEVIGWLFSNTMPLKPRIKKNSDLFIRTLRTKIAETYNDQNKRLFVHMLKILESQGDESAKRTFRYGTYRFEYVWEKMIDRLFGIKEKGDYFPKTYWKINGKVYENACLEPDTIMLSHNNVYILDAKYYKYGSNQKVVSYLPESTSINKQITYGEYVATNAKFRERHGEGMRIYNAFIMPFDAQDCDSMMVNVGEAFSDWKDNTETYQHVQGILLDVKTVMSLAAVRNEELVNDMVVCIENGFV